MRKSGEQLTDESRLANAGLAVNVHDLTAARERFAIVRIETRELALAADDLRSAARTGASFGSEHPIGRNRLGLPLQRQRRHGLDDEGIPRQREGRFTDKYGVGPCGAFDALCGVHRITGDRIREDLAGQQPRDDLAGVDADPDRDLDAVGLLEGGIQRLRRALDRERRLDDTGAPNTAMTASPMYLSMVPP